MKWRENFANFVAGQQPIDLACRVAVCSSPVVKSGREAIFAPAYGPLSENCSQPDRNRSLEPRASHFDKEQIIHSTNRPVLSNDPGAWWIRSAGADRCIDRQNQADAGATTKQAWINLYKW
ncbi:Myeloid zinc finger [Trichinella pseudospiralis]